jgi:hypothetical protein
MSFGVIPAPPQMRDKLRRESSVFRYFWMPAFAGMTGFWTFYGFIKINIIVFVFKEKNNKFGN